MLGDLQRQPQPRALEEPRRERVEELAARVAVRRRRLAEAEVRRDELDVGAGARERGRELVVVGRRERRRICQDDPHPTVGYAACRSSSARGTSSTATPLPPRAPRRSSARWSSSSPPTSPDVVCLQEVPVWALPHLERWSGMQAVGAVARAAAARERRARPLAHGAATTASSARRSRARRTRSSSRRGLERRRRAHARRERASGERRVCHGVRLDGVGRRRELPRHGRRDGRRAVPRASPTSSTDADERRSSPATRTCGRASGAPTSCCASLGFSEPLPASIDQILVRGLPSTPPAAWPRRPAPRRRPAPLRSRAGRTHRRMTFEEARAQFPVLERYAYLNAGTNGPLARATVDALVEQAQRDLARGPEQQGVLRADARAARGGAARASPRVLGVDAERIALVESTTRGCATVLAGLGLTGEDEVITTDQEHFGLTGPLYATGARVVIVEADEDAILGAITPRTRLIATSHVLWTTGRRLDLHRAEAGERRCRCSSTARSRRARSRSTSASSTSTPSRRRSGSARPDPVGRALRARSGARARQVAVVLLAGVVRALGRVRAEGRARRASTPAGSACRRSSGSSPRSARIRSGATSARRRWRRAAASCSSRTSRS